MTDFATKVLTLSVSVMFLAAGIVADQGSVRRFCVERGEACKVVLPFKLRQALYSDLSWIGIFQLTSSGPSRKIIGLVLGLSHSRHLIPLVLCGIRAPRI